MSTINLVINLTQISPWLGTSLYNDKDRLNKIGIGLSPAREGAIPRYSDFWYFGAKLPQADDFQKWLAQVRDLLARYDSVLVPGQYFGLDIISGFLDRSQSEFGKQHQIKALIAYDRPASMLEWCFRRVSPKLRSQFGPDYVRYTTQMATAHRIFIDKLGSANIQTYYENVPEISEANALKSVQEVYRRLGIDLEPSISRRYSDADWLNTIVGADLLRLPSVRGNAWPFIGETQLFHAVLELEKNWEPRSGVPFEMRKTFLAREAGDRHRLAALTGISEEALAPPEFFSIPETGRLDGARIRAFMDTLPEKEASAIVKKFQDNIGSLTEEQRLVLDSADFKHISEPKEQPQLCVLTLAYNHERFIGECIESVLGQKTDFPVAHIILDNYSTDSTPEIIAEYARKYPSIKPILLRGSERYISVWELFDRCRSVYAALCDGDDYFTDNLKLQKQVDFLRQNRDYSISFHPVRVHFEDKEREDFIYPDRSFIAGKSEFNLDDLFAGNMIQTNSAVYRWRFRDGLPDWFDAGVCPGDWYWHLLHAELGKIGFMPEVMAVYRRHASALYRDSFKDVIAHRKRMGMDELRAYDVINRHFKGKHQEQLNNLAAGVFSNFLEIYTEQGDSTLLDDACAKYPQFGKVFLDKISFVSAKNGQEI